ncbi:MAG: alcohol dehydrogenase catalytic domain-containing protein [Acidobacteriaceae bacterium]|nr:alcohol dehydrogenase catalytic domain-containing protein [Acidobacteriaceae bacterium]
MLAVHLEAGRVSVEETPSPKRPGGYALVRVLAAGICNTDLELQRGYYGFRGIPGHEFVGVVAEADTPALVGRRVAGEINLACGHCDFCAIGLGRHCPNRAVLGIVRHPGAFAEFLALPEANLHVVPNEIAVEEAVFIEPLAAACEILDQTQIPGNEQVAVLGDGKLGLLIAQVLHAHGARVMLYGRHEEKLRRARKAGIETSAVANLPKGMFPFVVDATGSADGLKQAVSMVRPRGTVILKSTIHGEVAVDTAPVIVNEVTLVGSRCGRFEPAIELLRDRKVDVRSMISAEYPLKEAPEAFAEAARSGVLKVLLRG